MSEKPNGGQSPDDQGVVAPQEGVMHEGKTPPIFWENEVLNNPEYSAALRAEKLAFEVKVGTEEMLSYLDMANEILNYQVIKESGLFRLMPVDQALYKKGKQLMAADEKYRTELDDILKSPNQQGAPTPEWDKSWGDYLHQTRDSSTDEGKLKVLTSDSWTEDRATSYLEAEKKLKTKQTERPGKFERSHDRLVASLQDGYEGDPALFEQTLLRLKIESVAEPEKKGLDLHELVYFIKAFGRDFYVMLFKAIYDGEKNKMVQRGLDVETDDIKDKLMAVSKADTKRLMQLLNLKFIPIADSLASYDSRECKMTESYMRSHHTPVKGKPGSHGPAKDYIKMLRQADAAMKVATEGHDAGYLRDTTERAALFGIDQKTVEDSDDMFAQVVKQATGQEVAKDPGKLIEATKEMAGREFLAAYLKWGRELRSLYRLLKQGEIAEVEYIREEVIDRAMPRLTKNPPAVVFLHGDFGTGKSAVARHIAKTRFHKDPLFVQCSKFMEPASATEEYRIKQLSQEEQTRMIYGRLYGEEQVNEKIRQGATAMEVEAEMLGAKQEYRQKVKEIYLSFKYADDQEKYREALADPDHHITSREKRDLEKKVDDFFSNPVQGRYVLQALYRGMDEGTPVIFDEANTLPPEVMIAFYDIFTKKFGEKLMVKNDKGEISVKEGFCIMMTGNTGDRYQKARHNDFDPAFFSRIYPIEVRYLPNADHCDVAGVIADRLNLGNFNEEILRDDAKLAAAIKATREGDPTDPEGKDTGARHDQIFQVLLTSILNDRLGLQVLAKKGDPATQEEPDRYVFFKDLFRLSVAARLLMNLFEKRNVSPEFITGLDIKDILGADDLQTIVNKLKATNLSMRELLENFITMYTEYKGNLDLEYYLFDYIKGRSTVEEKAIIYAVMKRIGFFQTSDGWPDCSDCHGDKTAATAHFREKINIEPLTAISKYKVAQNGESIGRVDFGSKYEYAYISSVEILQLLFGYFPMKRKGDYEALSADLRKLEASSKKKKEDANTKVDGIVDYYRQQFLPPDDLIKEFTAAAENARKFDDKDQSPEAKEARRRNTEANAKLNDEWLAPKYGESTNVSKVVSFFRNSVLLNKKESRKLPDDELLNVLSQFLDGLTDLAVELGWISEEDAVNIKGAPDIDTKSAMLQEALKNR